MSPPLPRQEQSSAPSHPRVSPWVYRVGRPLCAVRWGRPPRRALCGAAPQRCPRRPRERYTGVSTGGPAAAAEPPVRAVGLYPQPPSSSTTAGRTSAGEKQPRRTCGVLLSK